MQCCEKQIVYDALHARGKISVRVGDYEVVVIVAGVAHFNVVGTDGFLAVLRFYYRRAVDMVDPRFWLFAVDGKVETVELANNADLYLGPPGLWIRHIIEIQVPTYFLRLDKDLVFLGVVSEVVDYTLSNFNMPCLVVEDVVSHCAKQARTITSDQLPPFAILCQVDVLQSRWRAFERAHQYVLARASKKTPKCRVDRCSRRSMLWQAEWTGGNKPVGWDGGRRRKNVGDGFGKIRFA